ncbi:unnamed protein product, partial [Pleuronectes platessa]
MTLLNRRVAPQSRVTSVCCRGGGDCLRPLGAEDPRTVRHECCCRWELLGLRALSYQLLNHPSNYRASISSSIIQGRQTERQNAERGVTAEQRDNKEGVEGVEGVEGEERTSGGRRTQRSVGPKRVSGTDTRTTVPEDLELCREPTGRVHSRRLEIRLYARPDAIASGAGDYALHITKRLLGFYQDYFKVQYSLPKLDLLAVPKHPYAAMENWGLSVFVEQKILLDAEVSSSSYQMELTMVVVHEICHQWFGDLVTPVWWEDVWLKEGFAHYFEYVGTDFLFPKWNMEKQRFLTDVLHEVMLLDGLSSSHPISQEVEQAADINRVFDWIAYKKGAALIRMLANVMGQPLFQKGLNDYLLSHMYSNAARDDLWSKLTQAMRSDGQDINIGQMMDRWTLQMGYPVITITKNQSEQLPTHYISVSQEHFLYGQEARSNNSLQWQVPLTVAVGNTSTMSSERLLWINNRTETHRIGQMDDSTWLLGNINQTGYFRVNYDLQNWKLLIQQLHHNPEIISVGNRAGLIDDAFNLARAGYLPQGVPLQLIGYLPEETSFLPWHSASRALYQLDKLLDRTEEYSLFSDYVLKQVAARYHQMGWPTDVPGNEGNVLQASYQTEELQRELIMLACSFGNKQCHRQAVAYISDWISSNKNRIPPNIRDIVAVSEKKILLEALTCSDNTFLLNRLLNLSLTSDLVPEQDVIDVIIHVGRNPQGRNLAWKYFREKWDILNARYGEALFMNSKLISGVTEFLNTEKELNE